MPSKGVRSFADKLAAELRGKHHVFMEVVDTVVNVNRLGNQVMIDPEFLTEKARDAIVAIDPYRKGFDVFKSELIAVNWR